MTACLLADLGIVQASSAEEMAAAARLFRAYERFLAVDLCFQDFAAEVAGLPGAYAPPAGRLLLAKVADDAVGCVALRPLARGLSEMKRMWVEPGFAGRGVGRALAERVVAEARTIGYRAVRLDTLPERLRAARHLYRSLGFREVPDDDRNPLDGVRMYELGLGPGGGSHPGG